MPRVRVTLRGLMVAIAVVALSMEGWIVWGRYSFCRERAAKISWLANSLRDRLAKDPVELARGTHLNFEDGLPAVPASPVPARRMIGRMERLAQRYEQAARRPWLPIEADLREPTAR